MLFAPFMSMPAFCRVLFTWSCFAGLHALQVRLSCIHFTWVQVSSWHVAGSWLVASFSGCFLCASLTCRSCNVSSFHVCVAPRLCASMWECGQPSSSSRRPYVARSYLARSAPLFASAAQQHAPPPRGPILSELASVNGRGGGVLIEGAHENKRKLGTPPRRGGAPGGN